MRTLAGACLFLLAFEWGHAIGYKSGVRDMWKAEMAILHSLANEDDSATVQQ